MEQEVGGQPYGWTVQWAKNPLTTRFLRGVDEAQA